jgi:hypothetical protein
MVTGLVITFVVIGCVGDDPEPASSSSSSGSTSSSSSSSSSGGSGARSIVCDAKTTCTGTDKCCGVGTDWIGSACKADCGGAYSLTCDDAKDCGAGQVCCYKSDGGARAVASYCAAECRADKLEKQLCALGAAGECKTGACTPITEFSPSGLARCE